ncbi:hypothetical protein DES49_0218 [Halospina denitrificans]|uniref:Uncharacterized protein n=1 Tax=Halospina denitrificans TaxID=332522 RepID=A0A4R7K3F2_9GAMM|nr:hypothetical protein [Halospina denitrificans]TDT44119.1 hypothetical protein DES49_0218 [Halospina denitrificans]
MEMEQQEVRHRHRRSEPEPTAPDVALDQFSSVHEHLHERLCEELVSLEKRVSALRESPSLHSPTIISTYERMIRKKQDFMERWGMDTHCGCR